jgi:UDP-N-acetylglucosamine 1-carboxyvinyltransferase
MSAPAHPSLKHDDVFVVRGGASLRGDVTVQGAKNSALKLLAAALLAEGRTVITNVPGIADIPIMCEVIRGVGASVDAPAEGRIVIDVPAELHPEPPSEAVTSIRASIASLGPLVARAGRARIAMPGGDRIGARSIDIHLRGLAEMGATIDEAADHVDVRASRLRGADFTLDFPSVGATENLVMAAVLAEGITHLDNVAREPEIQDLCRMLVAMGARIENIGTATLTIEGVDRLSPVTHATCPDRIETATFAMMAAVTGGVVTLHHVAPDDLHLPLMKLEAAGVHLERGDGTLTVKADELHATDFVTLPYPGFPTDLQAMMMVLLSQAQGTSMCTENVFESRFAFVDELLRFGADVEIDGHHAIIRGPTPLRGATVNALDVRAGAASVMAGLVAQGETTVVDVFHIDRGYTAFVDKLRALGADIERRSAEGG